MATAGQSRYPFHLPSCNERMGGSHCISPYLPCKAGMLPLLSIAEPFAAPSGEGRVERS